MQQLDQEQCWACFRRSTGLGVYAGPREPTRWLCRECAEIADSIRNRKRLDVFELQALDAGVDAVGAYLTEIKKTDLADMDELEARMLVKAAWEGCGRGLREALKESPF